MNCRCVRPDQPAGLLGRFRSFIIIPFVLAIISGTSSNAFAQAGNFCEWTGPWSSGAAFSGVRRYGSLTRLNDGRVLSVGGYEGTGLQTSAAAEIYDPVTRTWTPTGSLATSRVGHVAVILADGRVLVAGGLQTINGVFAGRLASAEVYDPATGQFTPVASMGSARQDPLAVRLNDGRVLVAGGFGPTPYPYSAWLQSAEIFDPATGTFTPTGSMITGRGWGTATLLADGRVLMAGGETMQNATNLAEIYNPATGTFAATGPMNSIRRGHTATLVNGRVLIVGGTSDTGVVSSTEMYDPANGWFDTHYTLTSPRTIHAATLLPSGKVLITGGSSGTTDLASAELWNGLGFEPLPPMPESRRGHDAVVLADGTVLVAGGVNGNVAPVAAAVYDTQFMYAGRMSVARNMHTATRLEGGDVLIAGGRTLAPGQPPTATAELYSAASRSLVAVGSMAAARYDHTATLLRDGRVLVVGGMSVFNGGVLATAEIYDPIARTFSAAGSMSVPRYAHTATLLPSGHVLVTGGSGGNGARHATAELYNPMTNTFVPTGAMSRDRTDHTATLLPTGRVLIAGGMSHAVGGITYAIELYDPVSGTFYLPPNYQWMWVNREQHTATLLANGEVLVAGGLTSGLTPTRSAEIYNPWSGEFTPAGDMITARAGHAAANVPLPNGEVMILGGASQFSSGDLRSVEVYDHGSRTFTLRGQMEFKRDEHTATLLLDSSVLVAGGRNAYGIGGDTLELSKYTQCGPQITQMTPASGIWGTPVTIAGRQFGATQGDSTVTFNGTVAPVYAWSSTQISTSVPHGATIGPVVVTVNGIASNGPTFMVGAPDLTIDSITTAPAAPVAGQPVTVTVTVRNAGDLQPAPFRLDFYKHSATPPPGWGDFACELDNVGGGETATCTGTVTYEVGTHSLWAVVDVPGAIAESNESNNVFGPQTLVVQTARPDLTTTAVGNPAASAVIGGLLSLTDTVRNIGAVQSPLASSRLVLSLDTTRSSNDYVLVARSIPILAVGGSHTWSGQVTLSPAIPLGSYYVLACADDAGVLAEANEANNCAASATRVRLTAPDLMVVAVREPPAQGSEGVSFLVSDTVLNAGDATAGSSVTRYYLSLDRVKGAGDRLLVGTRANGSIAPGAHSFGSINVSIPRLTPLGSYYLIACADDQQQVVESDNNNNCFASSMRIEVVPSDIIIKTGGSMGLQ